MTQTLIIFGSETHNTHDVADLIAEYFDDADVLDIADITPREFLAADRLILGIPTWNNGEQQADWDDFLPNFDEMDLKGKRVALFGLGDQIGYAFTFLDAMGEIYHKVVERGAEVVGFWPTETYDHAESLAIVDGKFVGLAIDFENQDELTPQRVEEWVAQIRMEGFE